MKYILFSYEAEDKILFFLFFLMAHRKFMQTERVRWYDAAECIPNGLLPVTSLIQFFVFQRNSHTDPSSNNTAHICTCIQVKCATFMRDIPLKVLSSTTETLLKCSLRRWKDFQHVRRFHERAWDVCMSDRKSMKSLHRQEWLCAMQ